MNYLSPKAEAIKGALAESAPKKVSLYPNLGSQKASKNRSKPGRLSPFYNGHDSMITAAQLRAARGLLDWTRADLAKAANISPETVKNIEHGTFKPQENTAEAIIKAFKAHNVDFTDNQGVQIREDAVIRYEGVEGFNRFMDDVYETAKDPQSSIEGDKPFYMSNLDDRFYIKYSGDYFSIHIKRMNALRDKFKMFILVTETPHSYTIEEEKIGSYREYRIHKNQLMGNVPFYVYGDKLAILMFEGENAPQIVVISSSLVAKAYREQFKVLWEAAKPLDKAS